MTLIFPGTRRKKRKEKEKIQEKDGARVSVWNFRRQVGTSLRHGVSGLVTVDARLMPLFWRDVEYWQVSGKTGSSRNQSGHRVSGGDSRAQWLSVRQGAWQTSGGRWGTATPPPRYLHTCAYIKSALISWCILEVYSICRPLSVIRRWINNAAGTQGRGGFLCSHSEVFFFANVP